MISTTRIKGAEHSPKHLSHINGLKVISNFLKDKCSVVDDNFRITDVSKFGLLAQEILGIWGKTNYSIKLFFVSSIKARGFLFFVI